MLHRFQLLLLAMIALVANADRLPVVASFSILGDMVHEIGGDKVTVTNLVGPNGDAHVYQPSPLDARSLSRARLLVVNGMGFEGWIDRLTQASGYRGTVVVASQGLVPLAGGGQPDPHAWQDPTCARIYIRNIAQGLAAADTLNASYYQQRAQSYQSRLDAMAQWADTQIAAIPVAQRRVITSHNAFGYLGERFAIHFLAPQGIATESEASARDVGRLIEQIRKEKIRAIFVENISNPRLIQQISAETGVRPGPPLYSDALSEPDGPAANYLAMMHYNISALVAGMKQN